MALEKQITELNGVAYSYFKISNVNYTSKGVLTITLDKYVSKKYRDLDEKNTIGYPEIVCFENISLAEIVEFREYCYDLVKTSTLFQDSTDV